MPYLTTTVIAPDWIPDFQCLIESCPHTCCQEWNVEVDQEHGEIFENFEDQELRPLLAQILRKAKLRRGGQKNPETVYRFNLLSQPGRRCPIMDEKGACRLHRRYGGAVLCHTCYFFPRLFWQVDESYFMTLDLSCPEAARMAIRRDQKPTLARFEAEVDPAAEWMESSMALDPKVRAQIADRESMIRGLLDILQFSGGSLPERLRNLCLAMNIPDFELLPDKDRNFAELFRILDPVLDWGTEGRERSFDAARDLFMRMLSGSKDPMEVMADSYQKVRDGIYLPFIAQHPDYEENFLSHLLISDLFRQFDRYRNENVSSEEIFRHGAAYLCFSYALFRVVQVKRCMETETISDEQFIETVWRSNNAFWHYPLWLNRCLERIPDLNEGIRYFLSS